MYKIYQIDYVILVLFPCVFVATDLMLVIKEGLERWRCIVDESSFVAALETVEPVSLQQLNKLIGVQNGG